MKFRILFFCLSLLTLNAFAQDMHFSQFYAIPQQINPAFTGYFNGDIRASANYKNQWLGFGNTYNTIGAGLEGAFLRQKMKGSVLGAGLQFFNDRAGDIDFSTQVVNLQLSYILKLGANQPSYLSAGFQTGVTFRSVDLSKATFGNQFVNGGYDNGLNNGENNLFSNYKFLNAGAGLLWFYQPSDDVNFYAGFSIFNLLRPNTSFFSGVREDLFLRYSMQTGAQWKFNKKVGLRPSVMFQRQGNFQEMLLGTFVDYDFNGMENAQNRLVLSGGLWYRLNDALIPTFRAGINDWNITLSYDVNISSLVKGSRGNGGAEISLTYTGWTSASRKKNAQNKYKMSCPVL